MKQDNMYNLPHVQTANGINFLSLSVAVAPLNDAKFKFFFHKIPKNCSTFSKMMFLLVFVPLLVCTISASMKIFKNRPTDTMTN